MMNVALKIELNNLDKAMTEIDALRAMVLELAKTYPTTFKTEVEETPVKKTPVAPKKPKRTKKVSEPVKEVKEVKEPTVEVKQEEDEVAEKVTETMALSDLTALARETVAKSGRDAVKELVASFSSTSKLSDVPTDKYEELATALKGL
jgi:outer membrane biosynthesis protein TonB